MGPKRRLARQASCAQVVEALERRVLLSTFMVTNTLDSGPGSLRDDVQMSNSTPGANTITFAPGLSGTITLTSGAIEITDDLAIIGPGPQYLTISGNDVNGLFGSANLLGPHPPVISIEGFTLTRSPGAIGASAAVVSIANCDFIGNKSGVYSFEGSFTISHCTFSANAGDAVKSDFDRQETVSSCTFAGNSGFGIHNAAGGGLTVTDTTISGNAGGVYVEPNANGPVSLMNCVITGNKMDGVYDGANMAVTRCTVANNFGAGIYDDGVALTLIDSSVFGNGSADAAGGVGAAGGIVGLQAGLTVVNSTICNNSGGGIASLDGSLSITNSTITGNTAESGAGVAFYPYVGAKNGPRLNNTIVAANHDSKGAASDISISGATGGPVTAAGASNLIGTGGSGGLVDGMNGNMVGVADANLRLAPLGDYGGPTQTVPPLPGSPAIDAGSNALAIGPDGKSLLTDQRGYYRIFNGTVDIGAYEYGSSPLLAGDANVDGKVDFADFVLVARNYGKTNAIWSDGDFNNDGSVGFDDLVIVARNYGKSASLAATAAAMFSASLVGAGSSGPTSAHH